MVKLKNLKNKRKGKFLRPEIYNFAKSNKKEFITNNSNNYLNIRNSTYLKKFLDCIFKVHNGKYFVVNDPMDLKLIFKKYSFCSFKLGQFSYNKQIINRSNLHNSAEQLIIKDLKKKKGIYIKHNKKKKYIYTRL